MKMKKIIFYISIILLLYLSYIIINIIVFHQESLNNYGYGFLIGKIILLFVFGFLAYKTNPITKGRL